MEHQPHRQTVTDQPGPVPVAPDEADGSFVRVEAGSRLHFGLVSLDPDAEHAFGGIGLYVQRPALTVEAAPCTCFCARGTHRQRARSIAERTVKALEARHGPLKTAVALAVRSAPPEHCGFGLGTQLSLAVATAVINVVGLDEFPVRIAVELGRGRRSHVGLAAFEQGGFILDHGGRSVASDGNRAVSVRFPDHWQMVIVLPGAAPGAHGEQEERLLALARAGSERFSERLYRIATSQILPAVQAGRFDEFCAGLRQYGLLAGRMFRAVQGGTWRSELAPELAGVVQREFALPVVQSSWGPALVIPAENPDQAERVLHTVRAAFGSRQIDAWSTGARNRGATVAVFQRPGL